MNSLLDQLQAAHKHILEPPYVYREACGKLSNAQLNHNIKLRALSVVAIDNRTRSKYAKAFDGQKRTATELMTLMKLGRQGITAQLRKYEKRGFCSKEKGKGKEHLWSWLASISDIL